MPNTHEKSIKNPCVTEWCRCEKLRVMDTNVKCLSCGKVEALGYFQLSDMRYNDMNAVTKSQDNSPATFLTLNT